VSVYTDVILSDDKPHPTLQVRWNWSNLNAVSCAPFIEHVAEKEGVELIYNGTEGITGGDAIYTNWFMAKGNPSLGEVIKFVDSGIYVYQESLKVDDDSDWVADL